MSLAETRGATKAARKLGISVKTLTNWIRISRDEVGFAKDGKRRPVSDLEAETTQLRMESAFKKTAAHFAKESK